MIGKVPESKDWRKDGMVSPINKIKEDVVFVGHFSTTGCLESHLF